MKQQAHRKHRHGRSSSLLAGAGVVAMTAALIWSITTAANRGADEGASSSAAASRDIPGLANEPGPTAPVFPAAHPRAGSPRASPVASAAPLASRPAPEAPSAVPDPTTAPTGTALPAEIVPPARAPTEPRAVPAALLERRGSATSTMPRPYTDGCHGGSPSSARCLYGDRRSATTIALFGDSHALAWFPAIEQVAKKRGWRLLSLTASACVPAWIISFNPHTQRVMRDCLRWRDRAIERLVEVQPDIILVSGTRGLRMLDASGRDLQGADRVSAWQRGMEITLTKLARASDRVVLVADTPNSGFSNPGQCLARHPGNHVRCATPVHPAINYTWLNAELAAARATNAGFINPERWVCPTDPCPEVIHGRLVHRNGSHLTVEFAAAQAGRFERAIVEHLASNPSGS